MLETAHEELMSKGKAHFTITEGRQEAFAERLKELLSERGAVPRLAKTIGASPSAIRKWISGETEPSRDFIVAICEATGINISWLCAQIGPKYVHSTHLTTDAKCKNCAINIRALEVSISYIDQWLETHKITLQPDKKATIIAAAYECVAEAEDIADTKSYLGSINRLLRVAI